ncbi:hypothetical protein [Pararhizobium sp. O133]|uniref:hypothetical protein n=1 Tax=Pararhizobium sp. O133 TaxID=3449278 RepID=UPI003F68842E
MLDVVSVPALAPFAEVVPQPLRSSEEAIRHAAGGAEKMVGKQARFFIVRGSFRDSVASADHGRLYNRFHG